MKYFSMQGGAILSKHNSLEAAKKAIRKHLDVFKEYPSTFYRVAVLDSPNYWERGDTPYKRYWLEVYDCWGSLIYPVSPREEGKNE